MPSEYAHCPQCGLYVACPEDVSSFNTPVLGGRSSPAPHVVGGLSSSHSQQHNYPYQQGGPMPAESYSTDLAGMRPSVPSCGNGSDHAEEQRPAAHSVPASSQSPVRGPHSGAEDKIIDFPDEVLPSG